MRGAQPRYVAWAVFGATLVAREARAQSWVQAQEVTDPATTGGTKVALDPETGGTAVIAVPSGGSTGQGLAYIYVPDGSGNWAIQQTISPPDTTAAGFGNKVRVSGDTAIFAAGNSLSKQGATYVYARSGTTWSYQQKLTASDGVAGDNFGGNGLSISGPTLVVGASQKNSGAGAAYVFTLSGNTWVQQQELTGSGIHNAAYGAASVSGNAMLVGEPAFSASPLVKGTAYAYALSGGSWTLQQQLQASDGFPGNDFGNNVVVDGDTALLTAPGDANNTGAAYVFTYSPGTGWTQQQKLVASDGAPGDQLGYGISVHRDLVLVGAPGANGGTGAEYVFRFAGGVWTQEQKLVVSDGLTGNGTPAGNAASGTGVGRGGGEGCDGTTILLGTTGPNTAGTVSAYFFNASAPAGTQVVVQGTEGPTGATSSVTFGNVADAGTAGLDFDNQCSSLPSGLVASDGGTSCLSVTTTVSYSGGVRVCVPLPSPPPTAPVLWQCDPNPAQLSCPIAGIDPRLGTAHTSHDGRTWCCGNVTPDAGVSDPLCAPTQGLSLFAVGPAVASTPTPALGRFAGALAAMLAAAGIAMSARRSRRDAD